MIVVFVIEYEIQLFKESTAIGLLISSIQSQQTRHLVSIMAEPNCNSWTCVILVPIWPFRSLVARIPSLQYLHVIMFHLWYGQTFVPLGKHPTRTFHGYCWIVNWSCCHTSLVPRTLKYELLHSQQATLSKWCWLVPVNTKNQQKLTKRRMSKKCVQKLKWPSCMWGVACMIAQSDSASCQHSVLPL